MTDGPDGYFHCFISYKGGAGRTTTAVNVAYQLARLGRRVLVVDFDVDGPGVGSLVRVDAKDLAKRGLIAYLKDDTGRALSDFVIPLPFSNPEDAPIQLDFLPVEMSLDAADALPTHGDHLHRRMVMLRAAAKEKYDCVIIDSASGVSDYTALAFAISTHVTVCFRWSRQHILGTMELVALLQSLEADAQFPLDQFYMLATAVPKPGNRFEFARRDAVVAALEKAIVDSPSAGTGIQVIPEDRMMKWDEQVVTTRTDLFGHYEKYARLINETLSTSTGRS